MSWWLRVEPDLPNHPKWQALSDKAFRFAFKVMAWCCKYEQLAIPRKNLIELAGGVRQATELVRELVECGREFGKVGILEPDSGRWIVHDLPRYLPKDAKAPAPASAPDSSRARVAAARAAGKASAEARRQSNGTAQPSRVRETASVASNGTPNDSPNESGTFRSNGARTEPERSPNDSPNETPERSERISKNSPNETPNGDRSNLSGRSQNYEYDHDQKPASSETCKLIPREVVRGRRAGSRPEFVRDDFGPGGTIPGWNFELPEEGFHYAAELGLTPNETKGALTDYREKNRNRRGTWDWHLDKCCAFIETAASGKNARLRKAGANNASQSDVPVYETEEDMRAAGVIP